MKKQLSIIALLFLGLTLLSILSSYGIFESNIPLEINKPLAQWVILVNNIDVTGENTALSIPSVNWSSNSNTLPGVVAPGMTGYFEMLIDPSGTEVSFEYEISIDFSVLENESIKLVSIEDSSNELVQINDTTYKGIFLLSDIELGKTETLRFNIIWENDDDNNEVDSSFINIDDSFLRIPFGIRFSQYIE